MSQMDVQNPFAPPRAHVDDLPIATPEAIVPAERLTRFWAVLIDYSPAIVIGVPAGIFAAVSMPALFAKGANPTFPPFGIAIGVAIALFVIAMFAWGIYNIVLVYRFGQTIGKKFMGIRMVRKDGSRMSFARYFFLRGLIYGLLAAIPIVGLLLRLVDKLLIFRASRQCLHDNIADTIVVTAESSLHATLAGSRGAHLRTANF